MEDKKKETDRNTSPSASSSQGDMADTEDAGSSSQPPKESSPAPPPKKKRTRTLTTPHQAAVLHALLAQSRFPTTAMREEVGRSIGLSARKVQIWFQNQRQKARRPRGQNIPPLTRPPQFGPFPSIPSGSTIAGPSTSPTSPSQAGPSSLGPRELRTVGEPSGSYPSPGCASSSAGSETFGYRDSFSSEGYPPSLPSAQLSGPGVPGSLVPTYRTGPPHTADPIRRDPEYLSATSYGERPNRPFTADDSSRIVPDRRLPPLSLRRSLEADFPITLPPLRLPPTLSGAGSGDERPSTVLSLLGSGPQGHSRSQAESPFAYEAPVRIPPPFTLQPPPQWDDPSFSPFSRRPSHAGNTHHRFPHDPFTPPHSADNITRSEGAPTSLTSSQPRTLFPPIFPFDRRPSFPPPASPDTSGYHSARNPRHSDDDAILHDHDVTP